MINDQRRRKPRSVRQSVFDLGIANVWLCDRCKAHGPANFGEDETVVDATARIRDEHRQASPLCNGETRYIRLVNLATLGAKGRVA